MELHKKLKAIRKQRGLTLKEMSIKTGRAISFLSDIERGRTLPSLKTLSRIGKAYNQSLSLLLSGVEIEGIE